MAIYKGNDTARVINDYKRWVERIHKRAEEKVEEAVSQITNSANRQYSSNNMEQRVQLTVDPIYYKMYVGKNKITGVAQARPIKEFIYLEFGTRQSAGDDLRILTGFESGIDTNAVSLPYKSNNPNFFFKEGPIIGRYYFLDSIDLNGIRFLKSFWK